MLEYVVNLLAVESLCIREFWMATHEALSGFQKHGRGLGVINLVSCLNTGSGERSVPPSPDDGTAQQAESSMVPLARVEIVASGQARGGIVCKKSVPRGTKQQVTKSDLPHTLTGVKSFMHSSDRQHARGSDARSSGRTTSRLLTMSLSFLDSLLTFQQPGLLASSVKIELTLCQPQLKIENNTHAHFFS